MEAIWAAAPTASPPAPLATPFPPLQEQIISRLQAVRDPHTNMSILQLGMVEEVTIDRQRVVIVCRYPHTWYTNDTSLALAGEIHAQLSAVAGAWMIDVVMLSEGPPRRANPWERPAARSVDEAALRPA